MIVNCAKLMKADWMLDGCGYEIAWDNCVLWDHRHHVKCNYYAGSGVQSAQGSRKVHLRVKIPRDYTCVYVRLQDRISPFFRVIISFLSIIPRRWLDVDMDYSSPNFREIDVIHSKLAECQVSAESCDIKWHLWQMYYKKHRLTHL